MIIIREMITVLICLQISLISESILAGYQGNKFCKVIYEK